MTRHVLKVQTQFWDALADGSKPFEYRYNDRNYQVGDELTLLKYDPKFGSLGDKLDRKIVYILRNEDMPTLPKDFVILGLAQEHTQIGWLHYHPFSWTIELQSLTESDKEAGWVQKPVYFKP